MRNAGLILPLVLVLLAAALQTSHAQDGPWEAHTSFRQATDVTASDDALWVGTRGGVFRFDPSTGERVSYSVSDGLHSTDVRAIAFDRQNRAVWIGYSDGVFDRLDAETGTVRNFYDIQRNDRYPSRAVNRLETLGDSLYIATDFGVVVFDMRPGKLEVRDTYAQFGPGATVGIAAHEVLNFRHGGQSYVAVGSNEGIAVATASHANLQDPAAWSLTTTSSPVLSLAYFRGQVYAGLEQSLLALTLDGALSTISGALADIRRMVVKDGSLYGVSRFAGFTVGDTGIFRTMAVEGYSAPRSLVFGPGGRLWIADLEGGILGLEDPLPDATTVDVVIDEAYPQGPYHGMFSQIIIDQEGNLWAGGPPEAGTGIYRMSRNGTWTNFVAREFPQLQGRNGYEAVAADPSGGVWGGSWGRAVVRVGPDDSVEIYDETNSALRGVSDNPSYVVVAGVATDVAGTLWATNMFTNERLVARSPDGQWIPATPRCDGFTPAGNLLDDVYVDSYGNKWFTVISETNQRIRRGLLVFDSGSSIEDGDDDECRFFNVAGGVGQGLPSEGVHAVAEDRDGRIWIGTDAGPAYTQNTRLMAQSTGPVFIWPQPHDRSQGNFLLFGVPIRDVAVDAANRIWLATDNGAYAVEEVSTGGFRVVHHFTTNNSPLLSDAVVSIATDGQSGRVFLNTERGLISYRTGSVEPVTAAGDLLVHPNPVRIEGDVAPTVRIRGLVEATDLRIVTAAGDLIAEMDTRGGQATWDGRDLSGRLVPSGMYLVIAVGRNGEGRGVGKVAVVR